MTSQRIIATTILLCLSAIVSVVDAQDEGRRGGFRRGDRGGFRGGGGDRGGRGGRGAGSFLQRFDANGDGMIDPAEVPERMQTFLSQMAERAGLDPAKPISLEDLSAATSRRSGDGDRRGRGRGPSDGNAGSGASSQPADKDENGKKSDDKKDDGKEEATLPGVPGFGIAIGPPLVPTFDVPLKSPAVFTESVVGSTVASVAASADVSGSSPRSAMAARRRASAGQSRRGGVSVSARIRFRSYDSNRNGKLERDEWAGMNGNPERWDTNGDGAITVEELSAGMSGSAGSSSGTGASSGRKSYRVKTATERLPEGLPSWFRERDRDRDGQVAMWEYASRWSDAVVAEFGRYDLNGDGLITPVECLASGNTESRPQSRERSRSRGRRGRF